MAMNWKSKVKGQILIHKVICQLGVFALLY